MSSRSSRCSRSRFASGLEFFDHDPIASACPPIGANSLPRKVQVLACVNLVHQRVDLLLMTFERQIIGQSSVSFGFSQRELSICALLSHQPQLIFARSIHERPSPDHSRSAVSGHASCSSRASGTVTFSDSCLSITSHFACAYRVVYPDLGRD